MNSDPITANNHSSSNNDVLQCPKCGSQIVHHVINQDDGKLVMCINNECPYPFLENLDIMFYYIPGKHSITNSLEPQENDKLIRKRPKRSISQPLPYNPQSSANTRTHKRSHTIDLFEVRLPDINSIEPLELPSPLLPIETTKSIASPPTPPQLDIQIEPEILDGLLKEFDSIPIQPSDDIQPTSIDDPLTSEFCNSDITQDDKDLLLSFLTTNKSMNLDFMDQQYKLSSFDKEVPDFSIEDTSCLFDLPFKSITPINF